MNKLVNLRKKVSGFTLLEMVIVIAIIAMLMLLVIPNVTKQKNNAETKTDAAFIQTIQTQVDLAEPKPDSLETAGEDVISKQQQERVKKLKLTLNADGNVVVSK